MKPRHLLRTWGIGILAAIAVYALLGFFVLPQFLRKQIAVEGAAVLQREVSMLGITCNPFTFSTVLKQVRIGGDGDAPLATAQRVRLNFDPLKSLVLRQWQFAEAAIDEPAVTLVVDEQGRLNLSDLFKPSEKPSRSPTFIGIGRLTLSQGRLEFIDHSRSEPFATTVAPVEFTLTDFSTRPDDSGTYRLAGATAAGRPFAWEGTLANAPFASRGWMSFEGLKIPDYMPLLADLVPAQVRSGQLTINGAYDLSLGDDRRAILTDFTARVNNLIVAVPESERPAIELPVLTIDVRQARLFARTAQIARVVIQRPTVQLARESDGTLNLTRLVSLPSAESTTASSASTTAAPNEITAGSDATPAVQIDELVVEDGTVAFADHALSEPFAITLAPVNLTLANVATKPGDSKGTYRLTGKAEDGAAFALDGTLALTPFASSGNVSVEQVTLAAYHPYFAEFIQGNLRSGRVNLQTAYNASFGGDPHVTLDETTLKGAGLELALPDSKTTAVAIPAFTLEITRAQLFERSAQIKRVELRDPVVQLRRASDGTIDLTRLLAAGTATAGMEATDETNSATVEARVDAVVIQNGRLVLVDETTPKPTTLRADEIFFTATGASSDLARDVEVELSLRWAGGPGNFSAKGPVRPQPFAVNLEVFGENLALPPIAPYLRPVADVRLISGRANVAGRVKGAQTPNRPLALHWVGQAGIDDLDIRGAQLQHKLLSCRKLEVAGSVLTTQPLGFTVQAVHLLEPALHVVRTASGAIDVTQLMTDSGDTPDRAADNDSRAQASLPFVANVARVTIEGGSVTFTDRSVDPEFVTALTSLEGAIVGVSTTPDVPSHVALSATLAGAAPLSISGAANILAEDIFTGTNLRAELSNLSLVHFNPYAKRYLGYGITRGQMRGDFAYKLDEGELTGANHIVLDEFSLGEAVASPEALSVPVKFAIGVLRNRQDEVVLDVEVSGSAQSPNFSLSGVIQRAFRNVLVKAATAPLSLLGSIFGSDDEDLSQAEFLPGDALLQNATKARLDTLARALADRPGLSLVIHWRPMAGVDGNVLKEKRLEQLIQAERELIAGGRLTPQTTVSEVEALRSLARRRFPDLASELGRERAGAPASSRPQTHSPWYARMFDSLFGRAETARPSSEQADDDAVNGALAELRGELLESLNLNESEYIDLARNRATIAREHLIAAGIDPHRLEIAPAPRSPADPKEAETRARIFFDLKES